MSRKIDVTDKTFEFFQTPMLEARFSVSSKFWYWFISTQQKNGKKAPVTFGTKALRNRNFIHVGTRSQFEIKWLFYRKYLKPASEDSKKAGEDKKTYIHPIVSQRRNY